MIPALWERLVLSTLVVAGYIVALVVLAGRELLTVPAVLMLMTAAVLLVQLIWRR